MSKLKTESVLEDLIKQPKLIDKDYGIIHFDSPDKRGIDVALLYQKKQFQPTSYINIPLYVYKGEQPIKETLKTDSSENLETEDLFKSIPKIIEFTPETNCW